MNLEGGSTLRSVESAAAAEGHAVRLARGRLVTGRLGGGTETKKRENECTVRERKKW